MDERLCHQHPAPILPKTRYRYQMVNPLPTTGTVVAFHLVILRRFGVLVRNIHIKEKILGI